MSAEKIIPIESLITVTELKKIINSLPEKDANGEDFNVHIAEGARQRYSLMPEEFILEPTNRKLLDGSFGVELTICTA